MAVRGDKILFLFSTLCLSWLGMMAVHELGHVIGAVLTGGKVARVVLHPAAISRTDVSPNPVPLIVAWAGPIFGALIPLFFWLTVRRLLGCHSEPSTIPERVLSSSFSTIEFAGSDESTEQRYHNLRLSGRSAIISIAQFFSGFCCVAKGAYLGIGAFERVGDAEELLKAGSPLWTLVLFGLLAFIAGLLMWHRLGSPLAMCCNQTEVDPWLVRGLMATLVVVIAVECVLCPM